MSVMPVHRLALSGALAGCVLLASCSVPPVEATPPDGANSPECQSADKHWPTTVAGQNPYPVTTPSDSVRAWGKRPSEAIIARCGVVSPGPTTDPCINVDGVDWVQRQLGKDGFHYVTYGRAPAIEVLVPAQLKGAPATYLPAFTKSAQAIKQSDHRCQD